MSEEIEVTRLRLREVILNDIVKPPGGPSLWPAIDSFAQAIEDLIDAKLAKNKGDSDG